MDESLRYRNHGDRCEGYYNRTVSGEFQIASFTYGRLQFRSDQNELQLDCNHNAKIRAIAISEFGYRLDTEINDKPFTWNLSKYVLTNFHDFKAQNLGIFAWQGDELNKVYLPVVLEGSGNIFLKLMVQDEIEAYRWSWVNRSSNTFRNQDTYYEFLKKGRFFQGDQITLKVDPDGLQGDYWLLISLKPPHEDWGPPTPFKVKF